MPCPSCGALGEPLGVEHIRYEGTDYCGLMWRCRDCGLFWCQLDAGGEWVKITIRPLDEEAQRRGDAV